MNVANSISDNILRYAGRRASRALLHEDFARYGSRAAVDQALSRLVRQGRLQRIRHGLYQVPRQSPVLKLPVSVPTDKVMQAWARKNGVRLIPSGAWAANLLRLSTQVPVKMEYCTNGPSRTVVVDGVSVKLKHRGPRTMDVKGAMSAAVMEALRYLGKDRVGEPDILRLRSLLSDRDRADLARNIPLAPAWMRPILETVTTGGDAHE
jgi:hypothetical protein